MRVNVVLRGVPFQGAPSHPCRRGCSNNSRRYSDFGTRHSLQQSLAHRNKCKSLGSSHSNIRAENENRQEHLWLLVQTLFLQHTKCRLFEPTFSNCIKPSL